MTTTTPTHALGTNAPDLTKRAPRSTRSQLGGYVLLPRMLDKCRATIAGTQGEFHYNCPIDQHLLNFVGVDAEALKAEVAKGGGDGEILAWFNANGKTPRQAYEIKQWSDFQAQRGPDSDAETWTWFGSTVAGYNKDREDIHTWFDFLDLDDYCTYGGKA